MLAEASMKDSINVPKEVWKKVRLVNCSQCLGVENRETATHPSPLSTPLPLVPRPSSLTPYPLSLAPSTHPHTSHASGALFGHDFHRLDELIKQGLLDGSQRGGGRSHYMTCIYYVRAVGMQFTCRGLLSIVSSSL